MKTSETSGLANDNAEKKLPWNRNMTSNGDSTIRQDIGASSWPTLSETTKAPSNKSSSDSLTSLGDTSASASVPLSLQSGCVAALNFTEERSSGVSMSTNGTVVQHSGQSSYALPEGQIQRNDVASQSHGGIQNQYQRNSHKHQNGNHHHHHHHHHPQSHGDWRNQEYVNQNWNLHRNFNGRGGFAQPPRDHTPRFVRHAPPPPPHVPLIHAQYMQPNQPFYPFGGSMVFPEFGQPLMYCLPRVPFVEPHPNFYQVQEASLEARIRHQVHYYFSEDNLSKDDFMRKHMNDEGFVHIQFIAGFSKLKALTKDIKFILNTLQGSNVVELKGYEIRSRHMWKRFLMPSFLRITFNPSPEYEIVSKIQNLSLEQKANETGSSSSNQKADSNID